MAKLLGSCDPVILRVLERLRVVVSQGVEGLVGELAPRVNQPRWEGTRATGQAGFMRPWVLLAPVTPSGDLRYVKSSSPLLL